jgi:soluble lytic murein transglycosylase-like protein/peptidoglycan hydrolase-like protein with peptidoglycan-binding domain
MRRRILIGAVASWALLACAPVTVVAASTVATSTGDSTDRSVVALREKPGVAALQVALRAQGVYRGTIDGVRGPLTRKGLVRFQRRHSLRPTGRIGTRTRRALGRLGRPLLGQRELAVGRVGWDVASLEFRLVNFGLSRRLVDGRFTPATVRALQRFQRASGLLPDGIAGPRTYRALVAHAYGEHSGRRELVHVVTEGEGFIVVARRYGVGPLRLARANGDTLSSLLVPGRRLRIPGRAAPAEPAPAIHVVRAGEGFFVIAERYRISPYELAELNGLTLESVITPGQRLRLPTGARGGPGLPYEDPATVRALIDRWAATYDVDPQLARAVGWMESGFQPGVVSNVGAIGVMQLLPETWEFVDTMLIGQVTPRTAEGNVQAGVRYLRWQLDEFDGDIRLALAGWYQGARAVRERGLFDDTERFVSVVLALHGDV